ncbi:lipopolysaccharide transport system permease protein [Spirosomataceae bacterium TFI 002]|nr:lipopolysaccharide transport system permease protein [Spirosomataceae bacterium TFI 002]
MDISQKERVITARKSFKDYWSEIFESRELFWILAKRDVIVRYKQTVLGIAWAMIRPLITAMVMVFAFGKVAKFGDDSPIPYMLVVMPGVITWLLFSQSLMQVSMSIVQNTNLVAKVYFPRLIIPFSSFLLGLIDALIAFGLFLGICMWYGFVPDFKILLFPVFLTLSYLAAFSFGLFASVLNVKYRDIGQIIPFIIQFGYILSPVAYPTSYVESQVSSVIYKLYVLNPVVGLIDCMRWSLLDDYMPFNWDSFIPMILFVIVTFVFSFFFFRKHENSFVDYI